MRETHVVIANQIVPVTELDFESVIEPWAEFALEDGTRIRLKPVLKRALRLTEQFTVLGEPNYQLFWDVVWSAEPPPHLMKRLEERTP